MPHFRFLGTVVKPGGNNCHGHGHRHRPSHREQLSTVIKLIITMMMVIGTSGHMDGGERREL